MEFENKLVHRHKFSNDKKDFFKNIGLLPNELLHIVKQFIPKIVTIFLSKSKYIEEHHLILRLIKPINAEEYIRIMIRQDNHLVLQRLLVENHSRWLKMKNYFYRNCIYSNYLIFLKHYALDYESDKCYKTLCELFKELGLSKNQHKKKLFKYITWNP